MTYIYLKTKTVLRAPLIIALLICCLLTGILGGMVMNTYQSRQTAYSIGVVDMDQTSASRDLIKALERHPSLTLNLYSDKQSAKKALGNKEILQSYVLLEGFEAAIFSGKYDHIVEVVSMIKSPYSPWLNDQVSVSVIREWIISDGYGRMLSVNPSYSREVFVEAFDAYDTENELLSFTVIESDLSVVTVEDKSLPFHVQGLLWVWCGVLLLLSLIFMHQHYIEKHRHIRKRLLLSGINSWYYHGIYVGLITLVTLVGSLLFKLGLMVSGNDFGVSVESFILASILLSLSFYISISLLNKINLNLNQLVLIYLGVFMCWSLVTIEAVGIFNIGKIIQFLSPITLFFKICS